MLKETLLMGLLAPLFFRPAPMVADNDASGAPAAPLPLPPVPELPGLDPLPPATVAVVAGTDDIPWPELPHMRTKEAAVREFLDEMIEFCGGEAIRFNRLAWSYEATRKGRARSDACVGIAPRPWPPLKDKTLSRLLCEMGCLRVKNTTRNAEGRRLTYITIPLGAVDDKAAEDFYEPMRLVA